MKKINIIIGLILFCSLMSSCNFGNELIGDDAHIDYLIEDIHEAIGIELEQISNNDFEIKLSKSRILEMDGSEYLRFKADIGDTRKVFTFPCGTFQGDVLKDPILDIKIETLTDFNKAYSKNSLLNPIININYCTYLPVLSNTNPNALFTGDYSSWRKSILSKVPYPLYLLKVDHSNGCFSYFSFKEFPDNPKQIVKVSIKLGNGKVLSTNKELTIKSE